MAPGTATPSSREAMFTPSPIRSPSLSSTTSPMWMPMRNSMRRSAGRPVLRSIIAFCTSMAQRTASTTLRNSTSAPSPVRFTTRPLCTAMVGSIRSLRSARSRANVRSSSAPVSRLNPTTSAARIAASFLVSVIQQAIFLLVSRRRTYHATEPNVQDSSSEALYLTRDARLAESLGQMVDVGPIAEGQPSNMLGKGVFRIDLHQLAPDPTGFLGLAQMAERDSKKGAGEVGLRGELDTLLEQRRGSFEFAGDKIGRAEKVDV